MIRGSILSSKWAGDLSGLGVKAEMTELLAAAETVPGSIRGGAGWDESTKEMRPCERASVRACI